MSFEPGDKSWKPTMSDGRRGPGRHNVDAGNTAAVLECRLNRRCNASSMYRKLNSCGGVMLPARA